MTIMPGAVWRPISVPGGLSRRTKGRGVILHVAASEATSLWGFFNGNSNANSHFYVAKDGTIEQYIDTDYQSWTSMAANKNTIGVESQGGVTNPDGEPWTTAQVASLARLCAWAHSDEGVPLQVMPNSLPASRGIGYHRLGINPWRISGGEVWSSSNGKICPGAAKIAQIPTIVQSALNGEPDLDANQAQQLTDIWKWMRGGDPNVDNMTLLWTQLKDVQSMLRGNNTGGRNNFHWLDAQDQARASALIAELQALLAKVPGYPVTPPAA